MTSRSLRERIAPVALVVVLTIVESAGSTTNAAVTFMVTNTSDSGPGSLRQAMLDANSNPGADAIVFNIPGAPPFTIKPLSALPAIGDPVSIDATTQPGFAGSPVVELDGSLAGGATGLLITSGSSVVKALVINHFSSGDCIRLQSGGGNLIVGSYIGLDATGTIQGACGPLRVLSNNNTIGGTTSAERNIISGLILISGGSATGNAVQGNFIGTDRTGTAFLLGVVSIENGASNNVLGGTTTGSGNVVGGTVGNLVSIDLASNNLVAGNFIGTDVTGTLRRNGGGAGVTIGDGSANMIGGTSPQARNVISGNNGTGVGIQGPSATGNVVQGNYIGTDPSGTFAVPNLSANVTLGFFTSGNTIGGVIPGARNLISGGANRGIWITGNASGNLVQGNYIGTDSTGAIALGNSSGVEVETAGNTIGGTAPAARNVISGNTDGVLFIGGSAISNLVQGNLIGTSASGTSALANSNVGVYLSNTASGNTVGGTVAGAGNVVAFNGATGVFADSGTGNGILGNSIFSNTQLGIDLSPPGVTPNDPGDADGGANQLQNFPVLTSAGTTGAVTTVAGTLNSQAGTSYRLEFFANSACDPSGNGEGETFLGARTATTDGGGNASFTFTFGAVPAGRLITATATDPTNNTSEFSSCVTVVSLIGPPSSLTLSPKTATNTVGDMHCVTATVKDASGTALAGVMVRFSVPTATATHASPSTGFASTNTSGQAMFCYSASLPGQDTIHAFADTNNNTSQDGGEPFDDATKTWNLPANTSFCEVTITQGGAIIADNGDTANFGGNAKVSANGTSVQGEENYQDQGPAQPMQVHSVQLTATTCSNDLKSATIFGRATIDGSGNHAFRIDVTDQGEAGTNDTYGIILSNGYVSGQHQLRGGNVQIHKS
jgi:hypothetical protein